jgi:SpoVK/Ycf46/Vps4 family AAA+-type ATPase
MSANSSMKAELIKHVKNMTEDQDAAGGPMLDVEEIALRLKETQRYKMVTLDALKKIVKEIAGKNILNIAPQKEAIVDHNHLGKREVEKDKNMNDGETGFLPIKENKNVSFIQLNEVKGMDEAVKDLQQMASTFKDKRHQFASLGVEKVNRNMLIVGQQGSGKSNLAYAFANEMGLPTKIVHAIELLSSIANQGQVKIRKLFEEAVNLQPSIVIIEDLECIASHKESNTKESEKKIVFQLSNSLESVAGVAT